jgi:hypothetical protein
MTPLQEQMLSELQSKKLFKQAQEYAFHYLDTAPERNIYPTEEALANLRVFEEPMPRHGTDPANVLEQLNTYASPANVIQIYGRYFFLGPEHGHVCTKPCRRQARRCC